MVPFGSQGRAARNTLVRYERHPRPLAGTVGGSHYQLTPLLLSHGVGRFFAPYADVGQDFRPELRRKQLLPRLQADDSSCQILQLGIESIESLRYGSLHLLHSVS